MKKFIFGAATVLGVMATAQTTPSRTTSVNPGAMFGLKAGMNVSAMTEDTGLSDNKSKIGFNAGVFANLPISENFAIQPEVLYSQAGEKVIEKYNNVEYTSSQNLSYIDVPVMFQYKVTPEFFLEAGPQFGFLVASKLKYDADLKNYDVNYSNSYDNKDDFNNFNFGVGIGAGYWFTDNLGLNARYTAGVSDLTKNVTYGGVTYDNNRKSNVFQVGLNFKF